jgi:hypothetical protein
VPSNAQFASPDVARVADGVRAAFVEVLGKRLGALVVHGGAVTGFIPGFSDFDFVVFSHGILRLADALEIQQQLAGLESEPFAYLQLSRLVDLDDTTERQEGLIAGAYVTVHGRLPEGWALHSEATLRERGSQSLRRIEPVLQRLSNDWSVANAAQRQGVVRYLATVLKPAVRGLLCELGDPVTDVWRAPYDELARRLGAHDVTLANGMDELLTLLPPTTEQEPRAARLLFELLDAVRRRAETAPL